MPAKYRPVTTIARGMGFLPLMGRIMVRTYPFIYRVTHRPPDHQTAAGAAYKKGLWVALGLKDGLVGFTELVFFLR